MTVELMRSNVDPFLLEILKSSFDTIADDMALNLMRTAYSGIVRDSMDFSTAILDHRGQTLAQGLTTPMHLGSFYDAMTGLMRRFEGRITPGDVFIFNDPYAAGGMHLPDIYIVKPIYCEADICGWACALAHHSDVGGIVAGSNALSAHEIYQEGLRIPYVKFIAAGKPVEGIWDMVATNVRLPEKVIGDLQSQLAACATGERELIELIGRYGRSTVMEYYDHLHDYAERLARAAIRAIPDGTYRFTDHIAGNSDLPARADGRWRSGDGRLRRLLAPSQRRHQRTVPLHQGQRLCGHALDHAGGGAQLSRLHPRHHRAGALWDGRKSGDAGCLRCARHHRLPHHRLHVRRPRPGFAGPSGG
jgi:N-methylhydantoinase B/oxoprolinase/acetone carboxylase alpha subunit